MAASDSQHEWDDYAQRLGMALHRARIAAGLSQEQAAGLSGIATFTYQKLENGQSNPGTSANPKLRTLLNLSRALGVPLKELLPDE